MHYLFPWEKKLEDYTREYNELEKNKFFETSGAVKVAVLGSHTLNYFSKILAVRLAENGIPAKVWTGPYGQIEAQAINSSSELAEFEPDFVLVVQELNDAIGEESNYVDFKQEDKQKKEVSQRALAYCLNLVSALKQNTKSQILLTNFQTPYSTVFGSMEQKHKGSRRLVQEINLELADEIAKTKGTALIDLDAACANAGKIDQQQERYRFLGDVRLSFKQSVMLAEETLGAIISMEGKTKKCIVLDLDNTLWGGVIGEDGLAGIKLGQTEPIGKAYREFQKEILKLHKRGVILAINSKNNYDDAMEAINKHSEMVLKEDHFGALRINWQDKATNIQELAGELNIGLDAMVFIDDEPFNIELVRQRFPQVTCILLPKEQTSYPLLIKTLKLFDSASLTEEDFARGKMYSDDKKRKESVKTFKSYDDFLQSLELVMQVKPIDAVSVPRVSQMSMRTNQFNMTTKRYSEENIAKFMQDKNHTVHWMSVKDKFGDYGTVGACIVEIKKTKEKQPKLAEVDSFYMSCRVLGKGIENSFIWKVLTDLKKRGVETVHATAIPTSKNKPFLDFYTKAGFAKKKESKKEIGFEFDLKNAKIAFPKHIKWE